jgi:hypothetical protein
MSCTHDRIFIDVGFRHFKGQITGFLLTGKCDECGGIGESFCVRADPTKIQIMGMRAIENAKQKIWSLEEMYSQTPKRTYNPPSQGEKDK